MPEVAVILDIEDFTDAVQKTDYKKYRGYYELDGPCQSCGKSLEEGLVFGIARLSSGKEWYKSGQSFEPGGHFEFDRKTIRWLFDNHHFWNREDTVCACTTKCAQTLESKFRSTHKKAALAPTPAASSSKDCNFCGKAGADKRCAQCKSQWYCSRTCQKDAWKTHSKLCKKNCGRSPCT